MAPRFEVMAEVDGAEFFMDQNRNWRWCIENATFTHREACEFVVHAGSGEGSMVEKVVASMKTFGCSAKFIKAFTSCAEQGAVRVLFYA